MSIKWWLKEENPVYIYNGKLLGPQKNEILTFVPKWLKIEIIMLSEISLPLKETHFAFFHLWKLV